MTRREIAFLLIGAGAGLPFTIIGVADVIAVSLHHMFIFGFAWTPRLIVFGGPFLPLVLGCILLYQDRSKA